MERKLTYSQVAQGLTHTGWLSGTHTTLLCTPAPLVYVCHWCPQVPRWMRRFAVVRPLPGAQELVAQVKKQVVEWCGVQVSGENEVGIRGSNIVLRSWMYCACPKNWFALTDCCSAYPGHGQPTSPTLALTLG